MQLEKKTLRITVDPAFTSLQTTFETGSFWVPRRPGEGQPPILNFALSEVKDLEEEFEDQVQEGATPGERYWDLLRAYFEIKRDGIYKSSDSLITLGGFPTRVRRAYSRQSIMGAPEEELFHLFVNVDFGDGTMQEFSCDCRMVEAETFEPLFWQAIRSAEFFGDRAAALAEQNAVFDTALARIDAIVGDGSASRDEADTLALSTLPFAAPTDGRDSFRLGGFSGAFDEDATSVGVASFAKTFGFKLVARMETPQEARAGKLLSEYSDAGEVTLSFHVGGVYRAGGKAQGTFAIEEDRCANPHAQLRTEGLDYRLHFNGQIDVRDGWIRLRGRLGCSYENSSDFEVDIARSFDESALLWSDYQFTTLEEIEAAPADVVRQVFLRSETFPPKLLECRALQALTVQCFADEPLPIGPLDGLAKCVELERLYLSGLFIERLPEAVGDLKQLTYLTLEDCELRAIPDGVWSLPALTSLTLDGNPLALWPATIDLPAIRSISLRRCGLREVPAALAAIPALKTIQLEKNELESLPDEFNREDLKVGLPSEDKRRLLDYDYRGAHGAGVVEWDDEAYFARSSPALSQRLEEVLADSELKPRAEALRHLIKRTIALHHDGEENYDEVGGHRFGGMPDMPKSIPYPRFSGTDYEDNPFDYAYEFLAQIRLDAIADLQTFLPRTGMLYFFLTTVHDVYGDEERSPVKVIHYDGPMEELVSGKELRISQDEYSEMSGDAYAAFRGQASLVASPPEFYGSRSNPHLFRGPAASLKEDDDFLDGAHELLSEALKDENGQDHAINAYAFTQNEDPEHQASLARRGHPEDWIVLLKVGSRGDFQWGDAGDLLVVAHKSDIARGDFSDVFCTLESS